MADGDLLTIVAGHQTFAAASAVPGVQTVSLLGPFAWTPTALEVSNGTSVDTGLTVPAGALCIKAFAVLTDDVTGDTSGQFLYVETGSVTRHTLSVYDLGFGYPNTNITTAHREIGYDIASIENGLSFLAVDATNIWVRVSGGAWSGGIFNIYALIAEPS